MQNRQVDSVAIEGMLLSEKITIKAVVAYAARLRADGDREAAADVYASPYRPTEASARRLSHRMGPEKAIEYLRGRAALHAHEAHEHTKAAQASLIRHAARQARSHAARDRVRRRVNPGKRIDDAIARLRIVASPASSRLESDQVSGGDVNQRQAFTVDAAGKAVAIAYAAAAEIEALETAIKERDLSKVA